jgi:hypothetical protein
MGTRSLDNAKRSADRLEPLQEKFPPIFGRNQVGRLFPGIISSKTLANLANRGLGPRYLKSQGRAVYRTEDFLVWLENRSKQVSTNEQTWEDA